MCKSCSERSRGRPAKRRTDCTEDVLEQQMDYRKRKNDTGDIAEQTAVKRVGGGMS